MGLKLPASFGFGIGMIFAIFKSSGREPAFSPGSIEEGQESFVSLGASILYHGVRDAVFSWRGVCASLEVCFQFV